MGQRPVERLFDVRTGDAEEVTDEVRGLLIVAALLSGVSFVGGRMTAPVPPAEVRYVQIPAPVVHVPVPEAAPVEPAPLVEPAPPAEVKPPPKVIAKPKPKPQPVKEPKRRREPTPAKTGLPSCEFVKREYQRMSYVQQMAAYQRATPEQIAHGKRCLGF